jgi:hypothetical protein
LLGETAILFLDFIVHRLWPPESPEPDAFPAQMKIILSPLSLTRLVSTDNASTAQLFPESGDA